MRILVLIVHLLVAASADAAPPASRPQAPRGRCAAELQQISSLTEANKALKSELTALKESRSPSEKSADELSAELRRVNTELNSIRHASAHALQIQSERDNLQENVINLEREVETLKRAKRAAEEDHRQTWFLAGAGVLLGGIVLGVLLPQLRWRRRSGWDSF